MANDPYRSPTPRARLDETDYEQVVEHGLGPLVKSSPTTALEVGSRLLGAALATSERPARVERFADASTMWRPSIAEHRHRLGRTHATLLTDVVRDAALAVVRADPARLRDVVKELERQRWTLFRRIALYVLLEVPDIDLARQRILDPELLPMDLPEHNELVQRTFAALTPDERSTYVRLVETRPAPETYASGEAIEQNTSSDWIAAWRVRKLLALGDLLPNEVRSRHPELADFAGPVSPREQRIETGWVGDRVQWSAEQLLEMTMPEIIEQLASWRPGSTFLGPTIESQGSALREAAKRDPTRFGGHAAEFRGLDPTYVRSLLWGLREAYDKDRAAIAWAPVIDLAEWAISQPNIENEGAMDRDPGWKWTRKEICELLDVGLREREPQLPVEMRPRIWSLLAELVKDDPASSVLHSSTGRTDPVIAALNSNRGAAIQAIVTYVDWVRRHASGAPPGAAMSLAREAATTLEERLNDDRDHSASTRGAFGLRLVNLIALDEAWTRSQHDRIFPYESAPQLAEWTWIAFIEASRPYGQVLDLLRADYRKAIARISPRPVDSSPLDADRNLAEHLVIFYLWGRIGLNAGDLLGIFYASAPDWLRAYAMEFAGRVMRDSELGADECALLQQLWDARRSTAGSAEPESRRTELEQFGWWFIANRCDQTWLLLELLRAIELVGTIEPDSLVMDKLADIAPLHPVEAVRAVELLIAAPKERWFVSAVLPELERILRAGIASPAAKQPAIKVVNRLVADGYSSLAQLLSS